MEPNPASRPYIPDYGIPTSEEELLPWSHVERRMAEARNYWIGTAASDGRPHAVPTWGVWLGGTLHVGGGPRVRWQRNLRRNPRVSVHLDSSDEVVVIEGTVDAIEDADDPRLVPIDDAYEVKYEMRHGPVIWTLHPTVAYAWTSFPADVTRWRWPSG